MESTAESNLLGRLEYGFIVGLAVTQALLLYLIIHGIRAEWWWLHSHMGSVPWLTIVLTVPAILMLSVQRLRSRKFAGVALMLTLVYGLVALSAGYLATAPIILPAAPVLMPFAFIMAIAAFVVTPFVQLQLSPSAAKTTFSQRYSILFTNAWHNAITLLIALVFVGLGWSLISLWSALFKLINIEFFHNLFFSRPMEYALTGLFIGLGILISRSQSKPIQTARKIIFALFTGLLPVLSLIILLFLLSIPFGSFANLWHPEGQRYISVAGLLATLIATQILFFNAVYQRGERGLQVYPLPLRWLVRIAMMVLPIYAFIALAAISVRLASYGLTPGRYWALLAVLILALHCIGYALSALRRGEDGASLIPRVNVVMAGVIVVLALLSFLPGINPYSLSANTQAREIQNELQYLHNLDAQLQNEHYHLEPTYEAELKAQLRWLRFKVGRPGVLTLQHLSTLDLHPDLISLIDGEFARNSFYEQHPSTRDTSLSGKALQNAVQYPADQEPIPLALVETLSEYFHSIFRCTSSDVVCLGSETPLHPEYPGYTVCATYTHYYFAECTVFVADIVGENNEMQWREIERFTVYQIDAITEAMTSGNVIAEPTCWPQLNFAGFRKVLNDQICEENRQ